MSSNWLYRIVPLAWLCLVLSMGGAQAAYSVGGGKTFLTKDEALKLAFDDCTVVRTVKTLDAKARKQVEKLAGSAPERSIAYAYTAHKAGKHVGTAYFDVHRVRTMRQVLMVVVDPKGKVKRVELLAFAEPTEFIPNPRWYGQFAGRSLDETLSLKREIKGMTGATLTARATTSAVRRVLATHAVINPVPNKKTEKLTQPKKRPDTVR